MSTRTGILESFQVAATKLDTEPVTATQALLEAGIELFDGADFDVPLREVDLLRSAWTVWFFSRWRPSIVDMAPHLPDVDRWRLYAAGAAMQRRFARWYAEQARKGIVLGSPSARLETHILDWRRDADVLAALVGAPLA